MDKTARYVAPRTCRVVDESDPNRVAEKSSKPLGNYADAAAYVLIAEPGAGKTTAFESEAASPGREYETVSRFRTYDDKPEWHDKTLFLDGLDESRAGVLDGRTPLNDIQRKLYRLGCPPFRLSCRCADWMAATDRKRLKEVSPDGTVIVLRLDPLSERNVKDILANTYGVEDTDGFIKTARDRGVKELLKNPQNLKLLAESVLRGKWPDSRKEMFQEACRWLVREPNPEHLAANPSNADIGPLIEAAGRLCAVQLLSGTAGYTLPDRAEPDDTYPSLAKVDGEATGRMRQVLGTRLFVGTSEGKLAPTHRQIAEFLAAQYVSGLLDGGLSLERILALITGFDGELVPSFSNFVSWLAVHNKRSRNRLSQLDPSGLIYAGDRTTYSTKEKRDIVRNLRRESYWNPWCNRGFSRSPGIGVIVSPELEDTFREILSEGKRDHEHQSYVMHLLQMLADGEPLPALSEVLERIVRDPSWNQGVRCAALDVLTAYHARGRLGADALTRMLTEIEHGSLDDPQDELFGILLKALYPKVLSAVGLQVYLREPRMPVAHGEYASFWTRHVPSESTLEQLADLLDGIAANFGDHRPFLIGRAGVNMGLSKLPVDLLTRILRETRWQNPDSGIATARLYDWLGVASDPDLRVPEGEQASIRFDLEWNSDALKALIAHGVEVCQRRGEECGDFVDRRLLGARPFGYGPWCLKQALGAEEGEAASFYLRELFDCVTDGSRAGGLTVEGVRMGLAEDEVLLDEFDDMVDRWGFGETQADDRTVPELSVNRESPADTAEQQAWQARIAAQETALCAGRGTPQLLHQLAEAYLGVQDAAVGKSPRQRLEDLVGSRYDLIDLVLAGLEGAVAREDLPSSEDVVRLFDRSRVDWLVLPFLAGLHSLEHSGRLSDGDLNERQARLAVTLLYMLPREFIDPDSTSGTRVHRPAWFRTLLRDNPALVADTIRRSTARKLETGVQPATELHEMANAEDHREVAAMASLPVLESFPSAETEAALMALCWSLKAALTSCDWSAVGRVIEQRIARGDQGPAERACWLVAGYLVAPARFREDIQGLADDEEGLKWLPRFVAAGRFQRDFGRRLTVCDVASFVVSMGAALRIHEVPERAYWSTSDLIATLADDASAAATEALDALRTMTDAKPWRPAITDARERQAKKRREHEYQHRDIGQVVQTLDNLAPANAGDLAALVFDELNELSRRIRDGNTSAWRQHWNTDRHKHPIAPKHEDLCRDALLDDLQERLERLGIDASAEGVYADDKRSDIRVSFDGFNVPVEIKRSCHDDLWTAVHDQLIAKYTRDPGAAGYGIYLVFWFGDTEKCRPTKPSGWTPETAEDVKRGILESLNDRERSLISVCVVDVSTV